jgi:hypothetical protein
MEEAERLADWERYFADPKAPTSPLRPGAKGDQCRNIRLALMRLGYDDSFQYEPLSDVFDDAVSAELKRLQGDRTHTSVDGLCGPRTRHLLVKALTDHVQSTGTDIDPFARMVDPERRGEGYVFVSYAREDRAYVEALASLIREWEYVAWFDAHISGAEKFSKTLMKRIEKAYLLLLVETPQAIESEWVRAEVEHADRLGVRILSFEAEPIPKRNRLCKILQSHHRLGPAPASLTVPSAKAYRDALKQAVRDAHKMHQGA